MLEIVRMDITRRHYGTKNKLLAAASRPEALNSVALHAIMLAKRMDMQVILLLVLPDHGKNLTDKEKDGQAAFLAIRKEGEQQGVVIDCRTISGTFVDQVARQLTELDSPILIVGEGEEVNKRRRELLTIRKRIEHDFGRRGSTSPHFLIVTKRNKAINPGGDDMTGNRSIIQP